MNLHKTFSPVLLLTAITLSGCITPWNTRLPQLGWEDPKTALKEEERFDPYPMPDLGPQTYTRQRDTVTPRAEPRRVNDKLLNTKYGVPVGEAQAERSYNQIVQ